MIRFRSWLLVVATATVAIISVQRANAIDPERTIRPRYGYSLPNTDNDEPAEINFLKDEGGRRLLVFSLQPRSGSGEAARAGSRGRHPPKPNSPELRAAKRR